MIYRKLDEDNDYTFGLNKQGFHKDNDAVAQAIYTKIKLLKGEWWADLQLGLPLFSTVLGAQATDTTKQAFDLVFRDAVMSVDDVNSITEYTSSVDNKSRSYTFTCTVKTAYGTIEELTVS